MGYGDLFVAGLLGAALASDPRLQRRAALLTFAIAAVFDLLFLVLSELPATVPVALTVIVTEIWSRRRGESRGARAARRPGGCPSAARLASSR